MVCAFTPHTPGLCQAEDSVFFLKGIPSPLFTGLSISSVKGQESRIREAEVFLCKVVTAGGGSPGLTGFVLPAADRRGCLGVLSSVGVWVLAVTVTLSQLLLSLSALNTGCLPLTLST